MRQAYRPFRVGETVKVIGPFSDSISHLRRFIGSIGVVDSVLPDSHTEIIYVRFGPKKEWTQPFKSYVLQRGSLTWTQEEAA